MSFNPQNSKHLNDEDRFFVGRINDLILANQRSYTPEFSMFLDERQQVISENVVKSDNMCDFSFWGGYEGASRRMLCVTSEFVPVENSDFPMKCIWAKYRRCDDLTHRDFLGAIMSLQIKRDTVGDIVVGEGEAKIIVSSSISGIILRDITKIGRIGVKLSIDDDFIIKSDSKFLQIEGTVSSLRLDCIVAMALKLSREKTYELIMSRGVSLNCFETFDYSSKISQGDVFSIRGYGKFMLEDVLNTTKKGRIRIIVKKFL